MGYVEAVNLAFTIISTISGVLLFHFVIFAIVGIFAKKKFPHTEEKCRIGIIISARNEENVIGKLIESLRACDYPQDKVDIFVVAHNCTDKTAEVCRKMGAFVYEYNNPAERTLGFAYRALYPQIDKHYGIKNYDAFLVMNADNIVAENYLSKMNDAFIACGRKNIITSFRNSSNFGQNPMSCMYGLYFTSGCRLEMRGRTVCGCSTRVSGTGYMLPSDFVVDGWQYVTLTEDWEFTADKISSGVKVYYCDEAEFFDEQPTTTGIMMRQRFRWARGHMLVFFTRFKKIVASIFNPRKYGGETKNLMSKYDIGISILPLGVISIVITLMQPILLAFSPLFGYDAAAVYISYFTSFGIAMAAGYGTMFLAGILLFILEHKRIRGVHFFTALAALFIFPPFMGISVILDAVALFKKNVEWKPIPHYGKTTNKASDQANKTSQPTEQN